MSIVSLVQTLFPCSLRFVDGSIGTVHYFANGSKAFPKERLEVFAAGKVLRLDNYRKLQAWGIPWFQHTSSPVSRQGPAGLLRRLS